MAVKRKHLRLIKEAKAKAENIIAGKERSIYHFDHLGAETLPNGFEEREGAEPSHSIIEDDCCGMMIMSSQPAKVRRFTEEPYEDPSY